MHPGMIGGIAGGLIGLAGGLVGTWCSIRNTEGPRERAFVIRYAGCFWVGGLLFFSLLFWLPSPWKWVLWVPYGIALPLAIRYGNARQQALRREEAEFSSFPRE